MISVISKSIKSFCHFNQYKLITMIEYTAQRGFSVIIQSFFVAYGLLAYVIVLRPLCRFRRTMFSKPFFTICFALALLDILNLIDRLCLCISDPLLPYTSPFILQLRSFYERFLYYGIACIDLLVAVERAIVVFDSKLAITNKMVFVSLMVFAVGIAATNACIFTTVCPYILYPDTTVVYIDQSIPSAVMHNKVIDLALQPIMLFVTLLLYFVTGFKVLRVRQKIQSTLTLPSTKRTKFEHALVLLGIIITIPHAVLNVVYHISFYVQGLSPTVQWLLNFTFEVMIVLGSTLNPILHLILNKDLRQKTIESWCNGVNTANKSQNQFEDNKISVQSTLHCQVVINSSNP